MRCRGKGTLIHGWWEYKSPVRRFLKKLKIELPSDPAIPLLSIYLKKMKTLIWEDVCTPVLTASLLIIAKMEKQPMCPSIDEWIKKMSTHTHTHTHTHNGILLSHKKE